MFILAFLSVSEKKNYTRSELKTSQIFMWRSMEIINQFAGQTEWVFSASVSFSCGNRKCYVFNLEIYKF